MHVSYDIRIKVQQVTEMANSVEHVDFNSNNRRRSRNFLGSKGGFYFMGVARHPLKIKSSLNKIKFSAGGIDCFLNFQKGVS